MCKYVNAIMVDVYMSAVAHLLLFGFFQTGLNPGYPHSGHPYMGRMSISVSWEVNKHTMQSTSPTSVVF